MNNLNEFIELCKPIDKIKKIAEILNCNEDDVEQRIKGLFEQITKFEEKIRLNFEKIKKINDIVIDKYEK